MKSVQILLVLALAALLSPAAVKADNNVCTAWNWGPNYNRWTIPQCQGGVSISKGLVAGSQVTCNLKAWCGSQPNGACVNGGYSGIQSTSGLKNQGATFSFTVANLPVQFNYGYGASSCVASDKPTCVCTNCAAPAPVPSNWITNPSGGSPEVTNGVNGAQFAYTLTNYQPSANLVGVQSVTCVLADSKWSAHAVSNTGAVPVGSGAGSYTISVGQSSWYLAPTQSGSFSLFLDTTDNSPYNGTNITPPSCSFSQTVATSSC